MSDSLIPAAKSLQPWSILILGRALEPLQDGIIIASMPWRLNTYLKLLNEMGIPPYKTTMQASSIIVKFELADKQKFLRKILSHSNSGNLRNEIINTVFHDVYGTPADSMQLTEWNTKFINGKGTAASLRLEQIDLYNKNLAKREKAVHNAYQFGMGRNAFPDEMAFWKNEKQIYKVMEAAQVPRLYDEVKGKKDLSETVDRVYLVKTGNKPAAADKSKFLEYVKNMQIPYVSMLQWYELFIHPIG